MRLGKQRKESKFMAVQYFYEEKSWSINWMCRQLKITRAAYYKWLHREISQHEKENQEIAELIKEYDERFGHILGYRRMTDWINHFNHTNYSRNRIHRIMKKLGIHSVIRRKKSKYKKSSPDATAENKLKRDFNSTAPNEKWATDVTEFKIPGTAQKLFLSAILDLYDRVPVSYIVSGRNNNKLVFDTYDKAIKSNPDAKPLFHSDYAEKNTMPKFIKNSSVLLSCFTFFGIVFFNPENREAFLSPFFSKVFPLPHLQVKHYSSHHSSFLELQMHRILTW